MIPKKVTDFFALEGNYPDLDGEGAAARLSAAIRCKPINYFDHSRTDYTEFDKLHAHIKASYCRAVPFVPSLIRSNTYAKLLRFVLESLTVEHAERYVFYCTDAAD